MTEVLLAIGVIVALGGASVVWMGIRGRRRQNLRRFAEERVLVPGALIVIAGRFRVERLVEEGGMGIVYRAQDRQTGAPVALKVLARHPQDTLGGERFAREMEILAGLQHPRIARHVDHGVTADGQAYLAMEWLDGEDLRRALARETLSLEDALQVVTGAAEALAAVHAQGVVHRDLKPGNLFLRGGKAADVMLLDFGLARRLEGDPRVTRTAAVVGTPHYMAPEQASGSGEIRPSADVFSLGCIFYECLTGTVPFGGDQLVCVLAKILFESAEPVRSLRPGVPEAWAELLGRMLSKPALRRPPDAAALLTELRALPSPAAAPVPAASAAVQGAGPQVSRTQDQVLVSVVLAVVPDGVAAAETPTAPHGLESLRTAMSRFGCLIERLLDGSVLATIFPAHGATDQARIAARCALSLRELWPKARIAVTTGPAPLGGSARLGDAVDRAARLLQGGGPPVLLLDSLTAGLLDARFKTERAGEAFALVAEDPDLDATRPLLGKPTPCVGREVELAQLESLMATVVEEGTPRAAVVIGPPGIGKSRLRHELGRRLAARHREAVLLVGYGDPLSAGSPYVIARDALRRLVGIQLGDAPDAARAAVAERLGRLVDPAQRRRVTEFLGELCGTPFPGEESPPLRAARTDDRVMSEQIALAFLDWLAAETAVHPVVLVLEDVQWSDALTVKLMESTLRDLRAGALLVIAFGRPETDEAFPRLLGEQRAFSLALRPLTGKASEALVRGVLGEALGDESLARVVRLAGGNALFLEELIRAAADGQTRDVPETVLAMLQARLSRLPPEARLVLRAASTFGETFWRGAVERVCADWGMAGGADRWLGVLVDGELVEKRRESRFPGESELAFRHQLIGDAAAGLSTADDRTAAHRAAGHWLEEHGEPDAVVLARHARSGGEPERAIVFYSRAAEQSLAQHDFAEALARSESGVSCGAAGEALGILRSIRANALYSMGRWPDAGEAGKEALELLPAGGIWWCVTVEKLLQVLPNTEQFERCNELAEEMYRTQPRPEAREAFMRAVQVQLLAFAITGSHARGRRCLAFIDETGTDILQRDIVARGYSRLWRATFTHVLGDDMTAALALIEQAEEDLTESQVMYRLCVAKVVKGFIHYGLGDLAASEVDARQSRALAGEIRDDYHTSLGAWYLGLALCEQTDPAKLDEVEACGRAVLAADISPARDGALPRLITGRAALTRGDWARAESDSRPAASGLRSVPAWGFIAAATLMEALVRQGKGEEAADVARDLLALRGTFDGPICTEVLLGVAAAEALEAGGDRPAAAEALREALRQMQVRALKLTPPRRAAFLANRVENRRAFELGRAWFGEASGDQRSRSM